MFNNLFIYQRCDEDIESSDEVVCNAHIKTKQDIVETIKLIKEKGVNYNLRNKGKIHFHSNKK